jgi:hypothetical protein
VNVGDFRQALAQWFASPLQGITFRDWCRLVFDSRQQFHPEYYPRILWTGLSSLLNSAQARIEERRFGDQVRETRVERPLFILGPYRSGTTHLHNLLATDPRFGFCNYYQATFPHTYLTTEAMGSRLAAFFAMRRRPYDDVALGLGEPAEDELALCALTFLSYHMCWHFPSAADYYRRYITFDDVDPEIRERWKTGFDRMARKLAFKYKRPLVFKSPCHTARVALLLELYPDARFVHIHRDPFEVFQSTRKMEINIGPLFQFERRDLDEIDEHILWRYRLTYDAYLDQRERIPEENLIEISYTDLVEDTIGTLRRIYDGLDLPDFETVRPTIERYLSSLEGYRVNRYTALDDDVARRIANEWGRFFDEWGYSTHIDRPGETSARQRRPA